MVLNKIKRLRRKLHYYIEKFGLNAEETQEISRELDELINIYNNKQRLYPKDSILKKEYTRSIKALKRISIEYGEFPSVDEWNHYAYKYNYLNSESIKYISCLNWNELREKILYEINKKIF